MKALLQVSFNKSRRQAMALIMVITTVALMSILVVAIFSVTRTEYKATQAYVAGRSAKQLGDIGVAIVQAQIQNAQNTSNTARRDTHATQPGMVRVYDPTGSFKAAYKLYSSAQMKAAGDESSLYSDQHVPPADWHTMPARYVDLNQPVVRPGLPSPGAGAGGVGKFAVYFPVIDPRAAWNYGTGGQGLDIGTRGSSQVEGFSYTKSAEAAGSGSPQDYSTQVITPSDTNEPDNLRLPMPVEWLYVLQDGTVGALDNSNKFISSGGGGDGEPTADNPIVGRVAFWADDESCKININTAAEPTFMSTPFYYHDRDAKWAHFPAVTGEYQRYPGHPATVALSSVFAPNYRLDPWRPSDDNLSQAEVIDIKEKIYQLAPKIKGGGSESGTRPFVRDGMSDDNNEREAAKSIDLADASRERLYASVDEMLFKDLDFDTLTGRVPTRFTLPGGRVMFDHDTLERSRFFLTSHSRSPEFTIHGLPRVCMWPVADEGKGTKWRTTFDNIIALCATIKRNAATSNTVSRSYYFRRAESRHSAHDVTGSASGYGSSQGLARNTLLLDYLADQMSKLSWPSSSYASSSSNATFQDKYGQDNVNQLAIQFFDYIRSTNLYDGVLARNNDAWSSRNNYNNPPPAGIGGVTTGRYFQRDALRSNNYTYTAQRISQPPSRGNIDNVQAEQGADNQRTSAESVLPGHGQVSPAVWERDGRSYQGFGRMFTLSEIGFQFLCTADGAADAGTMPADFYPSSQDFGRGGATALRFGVNPEDVGRPPDAGSAYQGYRVPNPGDPAYFWSNFPPLIETPENQGDPYKALLDDAMAAYGCVVGGPEELHPSRHPGFDPKNWNLTLANGVHLRTNQKRVQVMLLLETFCPSLGWTGMYPEFTIVLDGNTIGQMELNGQKLFNTAGDVPIKSYGNIYRQNDTHSVGGHASPSAILGGRRTRAVGGGGGKVLLPSDDGFEDNNTSGHQALQNYNFASDFVTVDRDQPMQIKFPSEDIKIEIYDTHFWENAKPVQTIFVNLGNLPTDVPAPDLPNSTEYTERIDSFGRINYTRTQQGPHYWVANFNGCIGRAIGRPNSQYDGTNAFWEQVPSIPDPVNGVDAQAQRESQAIRGRLSNENPIPGDTRTGVSANGISIISRSDVIRSIVPVVGDYRVIAAMHNVPADFWRPHPLWRAGLENIRHAHSFTGYSATNEPGCKLALDVNSMDADKELRILNNPDVYQEVYSADMQLIGGAQFNFTPGAGGSPTAFRRLHPRQADLPPYPEWATAANSFGDFDTGISNAREGPYINKPDEGNFFAANETRNNVTKYWRSSYFFESWQNAEDWRSGIYMTPNRLISSPVMFGSLPTGVWGNPGGLPSAEDNASLGGLTYAPWQTLLFRPHATVTTADPGSNSSHPGMQDPGDHHLLDLFFMPVVEPYAISEPLSVAGRVNMNYQIMPFTNIRRATAMHAVMKGEFITAIPNDHITAAKEYYPGTTAWRDRFWNDASDRRFWHRPIDVPATLRQFDLKFNHKSGGQDNYQGLFRSASQICQMHLVPRRMDGSGIKNVGSDLSKVSSQETFNNAMDEFWGSNRPTGDNVRERPYSNLYARLTTRSNTFRVHLRTQVLKKARSTRPDTFDPDKDAVLSEFRGSSLIERYIDPNDPAVDIPDYAASGGPFGKEPLDKFYRFRVLETKRFNP